LLKNKLRLLKREHSKDKRKLLQRQKHIKKSLKKKSKTILKNLPPWQKSKDLLILELTQHINLLMSKPLPQEPLRKLDNWLIMKPKWLQEELISPINSLMFGLIK
jgi:hypothetical protein